MKSGTQTHKMAGFAANGSVKQRSKSRGDPLGDFREAPKADSRSKSR